MDHNILEDFWGRCYPEWQTCVTIPAKWDVKGNLLASAQTMVRIKDTEHFCIVIFERAAAGF